MEARFLGVLLILVCVGGGGLIVRLGTRAETAPRMVERCPKGYTLHYGTHGFAEKVCLPGIKPTMLPEGSPEFEPTEETR